METTDTRFDLPVLREMKTKRTPRLPKCELYFYRDMCLLQYDEHNHIVYIRMDKILELFSNKVEGSIKGYILVYFLSHLELKVEYFENQPSEHFESIDKAFGIVTTSKQIPRKQKSCEIVNGEFSWFLQVDDRKILFQGSDNAEYFKDLYQKLEYKVDIINN